MIRANNQVVNFDYNETFAPIGKMTIRIFLSVVVAKSWELHQMDVNNAFLHGDYMVFIWSLWKLGTTSNGKSLWKCLQV